MLRFKKRTELFFFFFFFNKKHQARALEKSLAQLRLQKAQLSAAKRELAGQMALVTGNTSSSLDRELKPLSKYIFWQSGDQSNVSAETLKLPAPLFVLHQSIQLFGDASVHCSVIELPNDGSLARWGLSCHIGQVNFIAGFSSALDLVAAKGNHKELEQLGPEGDFGLVSPSLTTMVNRKKKKKRKNSFPFD